MLPTIRKRFLINAREVDVKAIGGSSKLVWVERTIMERYNALMWRSSGMKRVNRKNGREGKMKSRHGSRTPG